MAYVFLIKNRINFYCIKVIWEEILISHEQGISIKCRITGELHTIIFLSLLKIYNKLTIKALLCKFSRTLRNRLEARVLLTFPIQKGCVPNLHILFSIFEALRQHARRINNFFVTGTHFETFNFLVEDTNNKFNVADLSKQSFT